MEKINNFWSKLKNKAAAVWDKFTDCLARFLAWCWNNKELAIVLISGIFGLIKEGLKAYTRHKDDEWRSRRFYDRRTDRWCYAKRKPTKRQERMIEERYRDGETYRAILDSMNLLK